MPDPYRHPAVPDPEPSLHERLLARVRAHREVRSPALQPTDAERYDRIALSRDARALAAGFAAALVATLLIAGAVMSLLKWAG